MKKRMYGMLAVVAAVAVTGTAERVEAQSPIPFALEVRAGAALPTGGTFADNAETGLGFGVSVSVQLIPNFGLYGGYSRTTFDLGVAPDARAVDSGFSVGLSTGLPGIGMAIRPWLGAGLLIHDLDVENVSPAVASDSQLGFEVGGGIAVSLAPRIRVTPGVGYRRYEARLFSNEHEPISYISAGVGLNVAF